MKRIVEIKRGDPVPDNARWIKDVVRVTGWVEAEHSLLDDTPIKETFDVFEITDTSEGG